MKKNLVFVALAAACLWLAGMHSVSSGDSNPPSKWEYLRIHWDGWDNTSIIRPDGSAERTRTLLGLTKHDRPEPADDRAYYLNMVVNAIAKEGYEVVAMADGDVIMKRPTAH